MDEAPTRPAGRANPANPASPLAAVDLNLLKALDALLQERSVTRAAARLSLTQPTISAALARLRVLFQSRA